MQLCLGWMLCWSGAIFGFFWQSPAKERLGRRLRALEAAVGQTLFQRTGEGFMLTRAGASRDARSTWYSGLSLSTNPKLFRAG